MSTLKTEMGLFRLRRKKSRKPLKASRLNRMRVQLRHVVRGFRNRPVWVGLFLTGLILGVGAMLAASSHYDENWAYRSNWEIFLDSPPNEIGDTLAGFAGALAFVWIIVTVGLQSRELAAQREELKLTRGEMEEQRKATQEMARIMKDQAALVGAESDRAERKENDQLLFSRLEWLKKHLLLFGQAKQSWAVAGDQSIGQGPRDFDFVPNHLKDSELDVFFIQIANHMEMMTSNLRRAEEKKRIKIKPHRERVFVERIKEISEVESLVCSCSDSGRFGFESMEIVRFKQIYVDVLRDANIWHETPYRVEE